MDQYGQEGDVGLGWAYAFPMKGRLKRLFQILAQWLRTIRILREENESVLNAIQNTGQKR